MNGRALKASICRTGYANVRRCSTVLVITLVALAAGCADSNAPSTNSATPSPAGNSTPAKDPAPAKDAAPADAPAPVTKAPLKPDELIPPIPDEPVFSPFGDPWDPTRPKPVEPETGGPGITSAKLVAAGPGGIKEIPQPAGSPPVFYIAVVDVTVPPGSTTDVLGAASITLTPAAGEPAPLFAACMPTLEDASLITAGKGTSIAAWTVAIGEQSWRCGGGNARMIRRVGPGGFKLTGPAPSGWTGPMVLMFEGQAEPPKSVSIAGKSIAIPAQPGEKKG